LAAALLIAFTGKWLLKQNSHLPAVLAIGCSFLVSLLVLNKVYERTHHEPAGTAEIATADSHAGEHAARPGWEHTYTIWTWAKVDNQLPVSDLPEASGVDPGAVAAWLPLNLGVTLRADTLTAMMLSMVTFISTLVVIYAAS